MAVRNLKVKLYVKIQNHHVSIKPSHKYERLIFAVDDVYTVDIAMDSYELQIGIFDFIHLLGTFVGLSGDLAL